MTHTIPLALRLLLASVLVALAAGCRSTDAKVKVSDVPRLVEQGQYADAVRIAEERYNARPSDPTREEEYRLASAALVLARARAACFEGDDERALELTDRALEIAPDEHVVREWNRKMQRKLADRWLDIANEWYAQDNLEAAQEACEKALAFNPGDERVEQLLGRVLVQTNYREGMSETYYEKGVHLIREYWLEQARTSFAYARDFRPENQRAAERQALVEEQLSLQRSTLAASLEEEGLFFAARNEYRLALLIDEDNVDAQVGMARADREAEATDALRKAQRLAMAGEYDEAEAVLESARALTEAQHDAFEGALTGVEEGRLASLYDAALALEADLRYEEAIAAYEALVERASYYRDAFARIDTLRGYVETAERLYAEAEKAESNEEKLNLYRQILFIWPEYRDAAERVAALGGDVD